jgi:hypothetical protein
MTLWSVFRSPLIIGGDLPSTDAWTRKLLTNPEVIAVDQHSHDNRAIVNTDTTAVWLAQSENEAGYYLAVFNLQDTEQIVRYEWKDLGLTEGSFRVRDLWERKNLGPTLSLTIKLRPHASKLYRLARNR